MKAKLEPITSKTACIRLDGALITVYTMPDSSCVLVDSGSKRSSSLFEYFNEQGIRVSAVIHTHLHSDHIANDRMLTERFGCSIYAGERDIKTMRNRCLIPIERGYITPAFIEEAFEGCNYPMLPISESAADIAVGGESFDIVRVPGHSLGHIGVVTPDGVCCLGDTLISPRILSHMKMPYHADTEMTIESMKKAEQLNYPFFVLAHEDVVRLSDMKNIAAANLESEANLLYKIQNIMDLLGPDQIQPEFMLNALGISNLPIRRKEIVCFSVLSRINYLKNHKL